MSTWQNVFCCPAFYLYLCIRHSSACMRMTADGGQVRLERAGMGMFFRAFWKTLRRFCQNVPSFQVKRRSVFSAEVGHTKFYDMEENRIVVTDAALREGAGKGMDGFLQVFTDAYWNAVGGDINAETMPLLNGWQHTLLGYHLFRQEVLDGGFVQLIQNGYGPYIFDNPFAKAMRLMGAKDFSKLIYDAKGYYDAHREELERECTDDEFMAMYEQHEFFDDLEEAFMENEEEITELVARYVDEHLQDFARIEG